MDGVIEMCIRDSGESKELYLGSYTLEQAGIPRYYAGINEQPEALVEKKNGEDPPIQDVYKRQVRF